MQLKATTAAQIASDLEEGDIVLKWSKGGKSEGGEGQEVSDLYDAHNSVMNTLTGGEQGEAKGW